MATIWLVDDDEVDGMVFARAAAAVAPGVDVVIMETADECLARIDGGETPALLLIDWHLPPAGGAALLAALGERGSIAALVLSGSESPDDRDAAIAAGARAWVVKETRPEAMRETLRALLAEHIER